MCVCGVLTYNIIYIYYYVLGVPTRLHHPFFPRARNLVITIVVVVVVVVVVLYIRKRKRVLKIRDYESVGASTAAAVWSVDREKLRGKIITIYHVPI